MQALCRLASSFTAVNLSAPFRRNIPWNKRAPTPAATLRGQAGCPIVLLLAQTQWGSAPGGRASVGLFVPPDIGSAGCLFSGRGTERAHKGSQNRACLQGQSHGYQAHTFLQGLAKCVFLCSKIMSNHTFKLILEYALLLEAHCFFFNTVTMHVLGILKNPGEFLGFFWC